MTKNQLKAFINEVDRTPDLRKEIASGNADLLKIASQAGYKITKKDAKGFFAEIKQITKCDKMNMPPLVVLIMAYLNILFPDDEKIVDV